MTRYFAAWLCATSSCLCISRRALSSIASPKSSIDFLTFSLFSAVAGPRRQLLVCSPAMLHVGSGSNLRRVSLTSRSRAVRRGLTFSVSSSVRSSRKSFICIAMSATWLSRAPCCSASASKAARAACTASAVVARPWRSTVTSDSNFARKVDVSVSKRRRCSSMRKILLSQERVFSPSREAGATPSRRTMGCERKEGGPSAASAFLSRKVVDSSLRAMIPTAFRHGSGCCR
mmetsp:Transcript_11856/g.28349  ORF Transcript_11856/g.28349 Transcript_11856/m.28349 type:complete len:231 (-) Transcript_11856:25-717(-)